MMIDSVCKDYRSKIAEILFEEMTVISILKGYSVIFMNSATVTLFSSGETTY